MVFSASHDESSCEEPSCFPDYFLIGQWVQVENPFFFGGDLIGFVAVYQIMIDDVHIKVSVRADGSKLCEVLKEPNLE